MSSSSPPQSRPAVVEKRRDLAEVAVLLCAVERLDESLQAAGHGTSPAMVSLRGRPAIQATVEHLQGLGFRRFLIALRKDDARLQRFVGSAFGDREGVEIVRTDAADDGAAVLELLEFADGEQALIAPAGIHFRMPSTAAIDREEAFALRGGAGDGKAIYWTANASRLQGELAGGKSLSEAMERCVGGALPRIEAAEWIDCARCEHLERAATRTSQARSFNRIAVDATLSTITKTSERREKLRDEIAYYQLLPDELAVLFPRVIRSDACGERPFIELEYYGYPTLAQLLVYEAMDPRLWRRVLEHVMAVHDSMTDFRREHDAGAARAMFIDKVEERVAELSRTSVACRDLIETDGMLSINGRRCRGFAAAWPRVRSRLEALAEAGETTIIHGDLCFSNVLYDVGEGICRLIDPRGSFGQRGVWGDPRYDVAKLAHSSHGLYDFIVADLFEVRRSGDGWRLEIHADPRVREIHDILDALTSARYDRADILAIEGTLFLSMGALHADSPSRQIAMTLRGLEIWEELARFESPVGAGA